MVKRIGLSLMVAALCQAGVDPRTGNYNTGFVDLVVAGSPITMERVYNSKAGYEGWFGVGWGTLYETRLDIRKDGSIRVVEFGGGQTAEFLPSTIPVDSLEDAVNRLVEAAKKTGDVWTPVDADDLRREVARRFSEREKRWREYAGRKLLDSAPEGGLFRSPSRFFERIVKAGGGYTRFYTNGRKDYFDDAGRMVKTAEAGKGAVTIVRSAGQVRIRDESNHAVVLELDSKGHALNASEGSRQCVYEYSAKGDLVRSVDASGDEFRYSHDAGLNLSEIAKNGKVTSRLSYYPQAQFQSVKTFEDEKLKAQFEYDYSEQSKGHVVVTAHYSSGSGDATLTRRTEYFERTSSLGEKYTWRQVETLGPVQTVSEFNEVGLLVLVRKNDQEQRIGYDLWGRAVRKETGDQITELVYDEAIHKVAYVRLMSKNTRLVKWSRFTYSAAGELTRANDWQGRSLSIEYGAPGGKVSRLVNEKGASAVLNYDAGVLVSADLTRNGAVILLPLKNVDEKTRQSPEIKEGVTAFAAMMRVLTSMIQLAGTKLEFEE
jgi:Domain of unknown function (DUF6531)